MRDAGCQALFCQDSKYSWTAFTGWPIYMLFDNWERKNSMIQKAAMLKLSCQVASQLMHAEKNPKALKVKEF